MNDDEVALHGEGNPDDIPPQLICLFKTYCMSKNDICGIMLV
jgi:hypothetical protein